MSAKNFKFNFTNYPLNSIIDLRLENIYIRTNDIPMHSFF